MEDTVNSVGSTEKPVKDWMKPAMVIFVTLLCFGVAGFLIDRMLKHDWDARVYGYVILLFIVGGTAGIHIILQFFIVKFLKIKSSLRQAIWGSLIFLVINLLAGGAVYFWVSFPGLGLALLVLLLIFPYIAVRIIKKVYTLSNSPAIFVVVDEIIYAVILYSAFFLVLRWLLMMSSI